MGARERAEDDDDDEEEEEEVEADEAASQLKEEPCFWPQLEWPQAVAVTRRVFVCKWPLTGAIDDDVNTDARRGTRDEHQQLPEHRQYNWAFLRGLKNFFGGG